MAFSTFNITGLASGLDTASMIDQLMALERQPINRYKQRQAELGKVDAAWGTVNTKLSAVRSAVDALRDPDAFDTFVKSVSSDDAVAGVEVTGSPGPGSLTFTVTQLAKSHQLAFAELDAADASLWSGAPETFSVDIGGKTHSIDITSTTTLRSLADELNARDASLSAQVVQTSPGKHRLIISSDESGTANAITVNGAPAALGATTDLQVAADAVLDLGGGVTVTRSSNTISDLVAGVTVTAKQVGTPVTVSTSRDDDAATAAVKTMVDSINGVLTTLKDMTKYNPDTKVAGVLQGDPTARKLAMDLRSELSGLVATFGGDYTTASSVGISLTRDGLVTLDEAKLKAALDAAPDAVANLFSGREVTPTDGAVKFLSASSRTVVGTYGVEITAAASTARSDGAAFVAGVARDVTITSGTGSSVVISLADGDDGAVVAAKINAALGAAGVTTVRAELLGGALRLEETRFGSAHGFTVAGGADWGVDGTFDGTDVAGTIGGNAATGSGRTLKGTGQTADLALTVSADAAGAYGSVTVSGGISGAIDRALRWGEGDKTSSDPDQAQGSIARARNSLKTEMRRFDDQILAFESRLESREITMRRKFAALETALASVQSQSSFLGMLGTQTQQ